jgi:hypothetical protein
MAAVRPPAVILLTEFGNAGTMTIDVIGGQVSFTPSESYMRGPEPQAL